MTLPNDEELPGAAAPHACAPSAKKEAPGPPSISPKLQLKWGLALLGEEKARQYIDWVRTRLERGGQ